MNTVKNFILGELSGWKKSEALWFGFCVFSTLAISLYLRDTSVGVAASLTGTCYTLLAGKGKISCYLFGVVNTLLYSLVSYQNRLYGEVMLNLLCYFPMMFAGFICWKRNLGRDSIIRKTSLNAEERLIYLAATLLGVVIYALILKKMGDSQPVIDSLTTVLSVTAMVLTVKRCSDQWLLWLAVNALSVYMWFKAWSSGSGSAAVLFMWLIALANGVIFYIKWKRECSPCQNP